MQTFPDWLIKEFLKWQQSTGDRKSLKEFAIYLGVKPTTLSSWMNAGVTPRIEQVQNLYQKTGDQKIFDIFGFPRPDPRLRELQEKYDAVPEENREELLRLVEDYLQSIGARRTR